jgi:hypothetical protein
MKHIKLSLLAIALAAFAPPAVADHKDTMECKACCKSAVKCDACCKSKGKDCGKDCCKMGAKEKPAR